MPVAKSFVAPVWAENGGGLRWIGQRGASAGSGGPRSPIRPSTSMRRPSVASPTAIVTGPPAPARAVAAPEARRRLERNRARRCGVEVGLDLGGDNPAFGVEISTASSIGGGPSRTRGRSPRREWRPPAPRIGRSSHRTPLQRLAKPRTSFARRRARAKRASSRKKRREDEPAFVDFSAIWPMSGAPRAKEGSGERWRRASRRRLARCFETPWPATL